MCTYTRHCLYIQYTWIPPPGKIRVYVSAAQRESVPRPDKTSEISRSGSSATDEERNVQRYPCGIFSASGVYHDLLSSLSTTVEVYYLVGYCMVGMSWQTLKPCIYSPVENSFG